jgi:AcrR family transcriptional regulator
MARPVTIPDELILDAAREVFLEHGIRGTTAEVASRAGVSEGIVFKRFKTKEALFHAAMQSKAIDSVGWIATLPARVGKGALRDQLYDVGMAVAKLFEGIIPLHMHAYANRRADDKSPPFGDFAEPPPLTARKRLTAYFEAERELGRLGDVDPDVMARIFLGAIYNFISLEMMMAGHDPHPMPKTTFVRGLVDVLLGGAGVRATPAPGPGAPPAKPSRRTRR